MRARLICSILLVSPLLTSAAAQEKPKLDAAALKEMIKRLPSITIDLRKAASSGSGKIQPPKPNWESIKPAVTPSKPTAKPLTKRGKSSIMKFGEMRGGSIGKEATGSLHKARSASSPQPEPTTTAKDSTAAERAPGIALYVPLPPTEAQAARELVAEQIRASGPAGATQPEFEPFRGAVMLSATDRTEVTLVPIVLVDDPLRFQSTSHVFEGRIAVGLIELGHQGPAKKLSAPIGFQVFGDASSNPDIAQVDTTSPPFSLIQIASRDPRDEVDLKIVSNVSADPVDVQVPVMRARLNLAAKTNLQGWGLETTEVTIGASDGENSKGETVVLSARPRGNLTAGSVKLGDDGTAQVTLRSESTGRVVLEATSSRLQSGELEFDFEFPWRFLLAALIGGLAGGMLRRGLKRRQSARRLALELFLAVLSGALTFGLFVLGVNLVGFDLPRNGGEVLVAVVAALGAFFGTRLFELPTARRSRAA